jgi:dimethylhistidine N-methyltransferase
LSAALQKRAVASPFDPEVAGAALSGLLASPKTLPPKLFYDEEGCRLFEAITRLPEYYPTRAERALLGAVAGEAVADAPHGAALVEYGASHESKAELLLDATTAFSAYVPIDIAGPALAAMASRLARSRPGLAVHPIAADFLSPLVLPPPVARAPRFGFFPGSTIGNLEPDRARSFLREARRLLGESARFLVGVDMRKDPAILVPAYDDAAGVTAAFNLNLLRRLNREADADFDLAAFGHRARWNAQEGRIEMHLVSRRAQTVFVAGRRIAFAAGETIHSENSYKYTPEGFTRLAASAGWRSLKLWMDPSRLFSLHLLGDGGSLTSPSPER